MKFKTELEDAAYRLAMMGLQSDRYKTDADFKDAVDDILGMTLMNDKNKKLDDMRTMASDLAEDR